MSEKITVNWELVDKKIRDKAIRRGFSRLDTNVASQRARVGAGEIFPPGSYLFSPRSQLIDASIDDEEIRTIDVTVNEKSNQFQEFQTRSKQSRGFELKSNHLGRLFWAEDIRDTELGSFLETDSVGILLWGANPKKLNCFVFSALEQAIWIKES